MKKFLSLCLVLGVASFLSADKLRIASDPTFPPFGYHKGNDIVGVDADLAKLIMSKLKLDYELVAMDYEEICDALNAGRVDMAIAAIGIDEYTEGCDPSNSYYETETYYLTHEYNHIDTKEQMAGHKIGYITGNYYKEIIESFGGEPVAFDRPAQMFMALQNDRVEAVISDSALAAPVIKRNYSYFSDVDKQALEMMENLGVNKQIMPFDIEASDESETVVLFGRGKNAELKESINRIIGEIRENGEMQKILEKYDIE